MLAKKNIFPTVYIHQPWSGAMELKFSNINQNIRNLIKICLKFSPNIRKRQSCFKTTISHSTAEINFSCTTKPSLLVEILENLSRIRVFPFSSNLIVRPVEWRTKPAQLQLEMLSHLWTINLREVSAKSFCVSGNKVFLLFFSVFVLAPFRVWKVCGSTINNEFKSKKGETDKFLERINSY